MKAKKKPIGKTRPAKKATRTKKSNSKKKNPKRKQSKPNWYAALNETTGKIVGPWKKSATAALTASSAQSAEIIAVRSAKTPHSTSGAGDLLTAALVRVWYAAYCQDERRVVSDWYRDLTDATREASAHHTAKNHSTTTIEEES